MEQASILYVDDEVDNLTAFKAVFRRNYRIHLAGSGPKAIEMLADTKVKLIISDQRMPGMTGVEFFEQIKDEYPDAIRIVLTGYTDMQAIIDAINKGKIYHYVSKPWKADELKLIIDRALEAYDLRHRNRELERQNIQSQFEVLKNQINPHFLFNSMNILAAIIPTKPDIAVAFTKRFSKLYRSVLQLREQLLISLQEELVFVEDYFFLQQMRFAESLQLTIEVPKDRMEDSLPPFALQILVENAVKHNIVSEDNPLKILIKVEGEMLHVINNYQPRGQAEPSSGTGLSNLKARYALIGSLQIQAVKQDGQFIAIIPLIAAT